MRLRYTRPALDDLDDVLTYIAERSPGSARRVQRRIKAVTNLLLEYPRIGTPTSDTDIRRVTAHPYPYLIFYEVRGDEIIIHAIRHGARDPSTMPGSD
jgi:toxin ParE1/3/4